MLQACAIHSFAGKNSAINLRSWRICNTFFIFLKNQTQSVTFRQKTALETIQIVVKKSTVSARG